MIALGGVEGTKEAYRDRRGLPAIESLVRDVRYGIRTLVKSPGFAVAGIVILGLGIGVNTAIFTVVNAVVLRPLPFADADRIMRIWHTPPQDVFTTPIFALSPANFIDWEAQTTSFESMAIYRGGRRTLTGQGEPDAIRVMTGSASFLPIFGVSPIIGRGFTSAEDSEGGPRPVILSDHFWRTRFGSDPAVLGKTLILDRVPHVVIGVVHPPSIAADTQAWLPLQWTAATRAVRSNHNYRGVAKLKTGVEVRQAQADLDAISERLALQYPDDNKGWGALVRPLQEDMIGEVRTSLARAARRRRAGAADRVRQPRQPDAGAHARTREGDRRQERARRQPAARGAAAADRGARARHRRRAGRICGGVLRRRHPRGLVR